ncbi:uncharacterized protein STEHIDRAFT_116354 [Stereum hirsutum FP-91666 SS1]|uniref:Uncharacterized protein n=1 Tax=Stereum hirsutum (strain FP-91666) TaxID=721885 RepID=R7RXM5_STEHR|nr:uncharacterized protein STEHIDRAFT_116354 [Stereum hirsutum FP-91666 SS1]EIM79640.1 hypothetical protein STEHIDRAFT_116354 [Stereum hirsutum FP-91666 SS1]
MCHCIEAPSSVKVTSRRAFWTDRRRSRAKGNVSAAIIPHSMKTVRIRHGGQVDAGALNGAGAFYHQKEPDKEFAWDKTENMMGKEISRGRPEGTHSNLPDIFRYVEESGVMSEGGGNMGAVETNFAGLAVIQTYMSGGQRLENGAAGAPKSGGVKVAVRGIVESRRLKDVWFAIRGKWGLMGIEKDMKGRGRWAGGLRKAECGEAQGAERLSSNQRRLVAGGGNPNRRSTTRSLFVTNAFKAIH